MFWNCDVNFWILKVQSYSILPVSFNELYFLWQCPFKSNQPKTVCFVSFCVCRSQRIDSSQQSTLPTPLLFPLEGGVLFKRTLFDIADPLCRVTQHSIRDWKSAKCLLLICKVVAIGKWECSWKHCGMWNFLCNLMLLWHPSTWLLLKCFYSIQLFTRKFKNILKFFNTHNMCLVYSYIKILIDIDCTYLWF